MATEHLPSAAQLPLDSEGGAKWPHFSKIGPKAGKKWVAACLHWQCVKAELRFLHCWNVWS
eukprot:10550607-Prorocentrum_lima.AAC.1